MVFLGDGHPVLDLLTVLFPSHGGFQFPQNPLQGVHRSVIHNHQELEPIHPFFGRQGLQKELDPTGICSGKSAGSELGPSIIPDTNGNDLSHITVKKGLKHGSSCSAMGLPVVAHANGKGAPGGTCHKCPTVMGGVGELSPDAIHESVGRLRTGSVGAYTDEPALLDDLLDSVGPSRNQVTVGI